MKSIITLLLCTLAFTAICQENDENQNVIKILVGIVEGLSEQDHFDIHTLDDCIREGGSILKDFEAAVQLIKLNDISSVKDGIKRIGEILQVLPDAMVECQSHDEEYVEASRVLTNLLRQLRNPSSFIFTVGKNILINGVEINNEIQTAIQDWDAKNYEDFGRQEGKILLQIMSKISNLDALDLNREKGEITFDIFVGILLGFAYEGGLNHDEFIDCLLTFVPHTQTEFSQAVHELEQGDVRHTINGLYLLGQQLNELPLVVKECAGPVVELILVAEKLSKTILELQNPQQFVFHIGRDLIINGVNIHKQITQAVVFWNTSDDQDYSRFEHFGVQIGGALYDIFIGGKNAVQ